MATGNHAIPRRKGRPRCTSVNDSIDSMFRADKPGIFLAGLEIFSAGSHRIVVALPNSRLTMEATPWVLKLRSGFRRSFGVLRHGRASNCFRPGLGIVPALKNNIRPVYFVVRVPRERVERNRRITHVRQKVQNFMEPSLAHIFRIKNGLTLNHPDLAVG